MFDNLDDHDVANYAGDSTPYCADKNSEIVVGNLEQSSKFLFEWLYNTT